MLTAAATTAQRIVVTGLVQGVGFRPHVYRLAQRHAVRGWVRNAAGEVEILAEGTAAAVTAFLADLRGEAPPLAHIDEVVATPTAAEGVEGFAIRPSAAERERRQAVPPDVAICASCARELFDPADRRYRYPFITCTDCGPRYSVITAMPYDRERTTMSPFHQCPDCLAEYGTPTDRRYHSETNSCPRCGPRLWFTRGEGDRHEGTATALAAAAALLRGGGILALRGVGGFHLAVVAADETAALRLRGRKGREAKPFALMTRDLAEAATLVSIDPDAARWLASPERPIVLLPKRPDAPVADGIAPGLRELGVMLPATPLHHLLLEEVGVPLVMTSGNVSDEPILGDNEEALRRLDGVADGFLLHDREIVARSDDSLLRPVGGQPLLLRRSRGYAPLPLKLPIPAPVPLVAVGPHLKNTFTLAMGAQAWVSQHLGDLESAETVDHFRTVLDALGRLFRITPQVAVRDAHEGYLSTRIAAELGADRVIVVQHHHAHIAAVAAEHGVATPLLGIALDGTGAGTDGTSWGAEFLAADLRSFRRLGHFRAAPLPGGDLAVRSPWRAALGFLALAPGSAAAFALAFEGVAASELAVAQRQVDRHLNAPLASSMGRLFDAAAAILGVRGRSSFEGQAAMELEALAGDLPGSVLPCALQTVEGRQVIDPLPLLTALGEARRRGGHLPQLAADFHESVVAATADLAVRLAAGEGYETVALGGGCFQNGRLLVSLRRRLEGAGLRVLVPRALPPNDGAISYGQAAIGAALLAIE